MIKVLISDFDGTLVDTYEANFRAYQQAFDECGLTLEADVYHKFFGYRFDRFMSAISIDDAFLQARIKELKAIYYPHYFEYLKVNTPLLEFIRAFHKSGNKTAIASTARRTNLMSVLDYIAATEIFDLVLTGENVKEGKPSPEIYLTALSHFGCSPSEALVFEDSEVGLQAAHNAGLKCIVVNPSFYGD